MTDRPIVMIGIPTRGMHSYMFSQSLNGLIMPTNFSMHIRYVPFMEVGRARNILVAAAQEANAKYLMFIDEDVIAEGGALKRLVYWLDTHPEWSCVAGIYPTKTIPPEPLIFTEWNDGPYYGWTQGDMVRVKCVGNGYTLFRVADFDRLPPEMAMPYEDRNPWTGLPMTVRNFFNTGGTSAANFGGSSQVRWTEDMYFFRMAEQVGWQVWADTSIELLHYDSDKHEVFKVPVDSGVCTKPDPWNHTPLICNLGAGHNLSPFEVSVDLRDDPGLTHKCDVRKLPEAWANTFDIVHSEHVLEHFPFAQSETILAEWLRILKPHGLIQISVPDLQWAGQMLAEEGRLDTFLLGAIYGDQGHEFWNQEPYGGEDEKGNFLPWSYENNTHKAGFTPLYLRLMLERLGVRDIEFDRAWPEFRMWGWKDGKESLSGSESDDQGTAERDSGRQDAAPTGEPGDGGNE